jgi:hypothetical protein
VSWLRKVDLAAGSTVNPGRSFQNAKCTVKALTFGGDKAGENPLKSGAHAVGKLWGKTVCNVHDSDTSDGMARAE